MSLPAEIDRLISEYTYPSLYISDKFCFSAGEYKGEIKVEAGLWHIQLAPPTQTLYGLYQNLILYHDDFDISQLGGINVEIETNLSARDYYFDMDKESVETDNIIKIEGRSGVEVYVNLKQTLAPHLLWEERWKRRNAFFGTYRGGLTQMWRKIHGIHGKAIIFTFFMYIPASMVFLEEIYTYAHLALQVSTKKLEEKNIIIQHSDKGVNIHKEGRGNLKSYFPDAPMDGVTNLTIYPDRVALFKKNKLIATTDISKGDKRAKELYVQMMERDHILRQPWVKEMHDRLLTDRAYTLMVRPKIVDKGTYLLT